jgi:hypothetical protein
MSDPKPTASEIIGWVVLFSSLVVGFAMTAFAPI